MWLDTPFLAANNSLFLLSIEEFTDAANLLSTLWRAMGDSSPSSTLRIFESLRNWLVFFVVRRGLTPWALSSESRESELSLRSIEASSSALLLLPWLAIKSRGWSSIMLFGDLSRSLKFNSAKPWSLLRVVPAWPPALRALEFSLQVLNTKSLSIAPFAGLLIRYYAAPSSSLYTFWPITWVVNGYPAFSLLIF